MADQNPFAKYRTANPFAIYQAPAAGPKPSTGFAVVGTPAAAATQTYIAGGNEDPRVMAAQAAAKAAASASAEQPFQMARIGAQGAMERQNAAFRAGLERQTEQYKQQLNNTKLSPEERDKALASYISAMQLQGQVDDLRKLYAAGPGSTSGLRSILDYVPERFSDANARFNAAGNAPRGTVGQALGFTGGQLNTAREAEMAVGPYLPQSSDRDSVIRDKLDRLQTLATDARGRSIAQLGGIPDASGVIHPLQQAVVAAPRSSGGDQPPAAGQSRGNEPPNGGGGGNVPPAPSSPLPPSYGIATGATRVVDDPEAAAMIDRMVRAGATADQINTALPPVEGRSPVSQSQVDAAQAYLRQHPEFKGSIGSAQKTVPTTAFERLSASPAATFVTQAGDAAALGLTDEIGGALNSAFTGKPLSQAIAEANAGKQAQAALNPTAALLGNIAGATGGSLAAGAGAARLGLNAVPGLIGDAAYGAAYGAGENNDNRLLGGAAGGVVGAAGNALGARAASMFGRGLRGVQNANVNFLRQNGVPLTVGQVVGGAVKGIEDRLTGIPILGDVVRNRRFEGFQGFNRAAFDQGLAPIGATTNGITGEAGIDLARNARSQAYNAALDPVTLTPDGQFLSDLAGADASAARLPADMAQRANYALERASENVDDQAELSGRGLQQAMRRFRRTANENAQLPNGYDLGETMGLGEHAYTDLLGRQSPDTMQQLNAANAANRNVEVLRDAVNRGRNGTRVGEAGLFAPSQLSDAAAANARKFGNSAGTTNQPFFDLTRAGQAVLPSSVPDSGTAGRLATLALPAALTGAGGGAGYASGDAESGAGAGLGVGALLALGGTRAGQRALTAALLDRPDVIRRLGTSIVNGSPRVGMFGRAAAVPLSPYVVSLLAGQ